MTLVVPPPKCKVYTSLELARTIVEVLGDSPGARWLEPSFGEGAFLLALSENGVDPNRITAVDLEIAPCANDKLAQTIRGVDFIAWTQQTWNKYARIVANPPYSTLSTLAGDLRVAALNVKPAIGCTISPKSNYWCVFTHACLNVLEDGGSIGLVLPASWDYADYASHLRSSMPPLFEYFEVYRSQRSLFNKGDSAVVIIGRGYRKPHVKYTRHICSDVSELICKVGNPDSDIGMAPQMLSSGMNNLRKDTFLLDDIIDIRIGAVTGDSSV